jgi:hypothetical protein
MCGSGFGGGRQARAESFHGPLVESHQARLDCRRYQRCCSLHSVRRDPVRLRAMDGDYRGYRRRCGAHRISDALCRQGLVSDCALSRSYGSCNRSRVDGSALAAILASAGFPYRGEMLLYVGRRLGINWLGVAYWFRDHPTHSKVLSHVYVSIAWQPAFAHGWLGVPIIGVPFFVLNIAMLISCVPIGSHYIIDVIVRIALAIAGLRASEQYFKATDRELPLARWEATKDGQRIFEAFRALPVIGAMVRFCPQRPRRDLVARRRGFC